MEQKYFIKATLDGMTAQYDGSKYHMGENKHPDPDLSRIVCGAGFHLARTITNALDYVPEATEFYLATAYKILGSDKTKIRTDKCTLLIRIPDKLIDEHWAKCKLIDDEHRAKRKLIDDEYWAKCKPIDDEHRAKRKPIDDEYWAKCKLIDDEHRAKRELIDRQIMTRAIRLYKVARAI